MVKLTQSMAVWLHANHPETMALIALGHLELFTPEMQRAYIEWCKTDDGRQYLKGGNKYDEEYAKRNGIE